MCYESMNLPLSLDSSDNQCDSIICGPINISINDNCISINMNNLFLIINNPITSKYNAFHSMINYLTHLIWMKMN